LSPRKRLEQEKNPHKSRRVSGVCLSSIAQISLAVPAVAQQKLVGRLPRRDHAARMFDSGRHLAD
jgi:hypothetical protein